MTNAYISGTGLYVPPRIVTNDDLVNDYGIDTNDEWIQKRTGIKARRFTEAGVGSADLAVPACEEAIARAGIDKSEIDLIIFATLSPEMAFPGSGVLLQQKLGLPEGDNARFTPALDIRNQCSGFIYGLATASSFVQSGNAKHVLLVGAEVHSAGLDLSTRGRTVSALFGDAAGAAVISATDEDRGVRKTWLGADGRFANVLCQKVWDMTQRPFVKLDKDGNGIIPAEDLWATMDGRLVFKNAVEKMIATVMQACWDTGLDLNDIDLFAFHQANLRINQYVANQLGIPEEKLLHNIERFGNTTAATIPTLLAEAEKEGRLTKGKKVLSVAFGSGFTWGGALIDW